ncbi:Methyltransferase-like protein [Thalictrum thalictroides]|uniref:Methyltransferase-like protein n=1 Tax=Thalictrum thalictroides TaxID=46969 RepID=A0A7J6VXM0_THATH|nr:Methyltransferase-like protein [Thalictrum thalictroides]
MEGIMGEEEKVINHTTIKSLSPSKSRDCMEEEEEEDEVMSEVHLGCPPNFCGPHLSYFTFPTSLQPQQQEEEENVVQGSLNCQGIINLDEDGDLLLTRRKRNNKSSNNCQMTIQHNITSTLPSVGLQVWRAELALADFVLHGMFTSNKYDGITALELGAGTGLLGIILARVAKTVFLTDHGEDILNNCAMNVHLNSKIFENHQTSIFVRELDWIKSWPPSVGSDLLTSQERYKYLWNLSEVEEAENASLLLAADVIYSDDLTDALFNTLRILMSRGSSKVLYLALEKRYNFSLNDLDTVANGYSHFQSYLQDEEECRQLGNGSLPCFVGKGIDLTDIPQYVREYDRESNIEIWQIKYLSSVSTY